MRYERHEPRPPFAHRLKGSLQTYGYRADGFFLPRKQHLHPLTRALVRGLTKEATRCGPPEPSDGQQQREKAHRAASGPEDNDKGDR